MVKMKVEVTHTIHYLVNLPFPYLTGQEEPKTRVPHQPEYYNHILYYVQKGAQIT